MMAALVKDPQNIKLGIIGMTEGNGHPYSWSAIFNSYNVKAMTEECPFPGIPEYLNKEDHDTMGIPGAKVAVVYCDKRSDAEHVSRLSLVPEVVDRPEDMIGKVDAVIIATDIGSEHVRRATPFIEAGIPLFIDKPLCDNLEDLAFFKNAIENGAHIISSSSMRYAKEIIPYFHGQYNEVGELRFISMTMPKKWETYGIHALEALCAVTGPGYVSIRNTGTQKRNICHLKHAKGFDAVIANAYDMAYSPVISLSGTKGCLDITLKDSYNSFRNQLVAVVEYLRTGVPPMPFSETEELMKLVAGGIESRNRNGEEIFI
ncbi:MAG: oxidoreductase [Lentisphaerae bacterium]|nr:oxidoreductase [Lentisphaerota bacterium]MBR2872516.1 Gfo/Idh/MocA family oxidoreductase [Lentisphaeria bacterium]